MKKIIIDKSETNQRIDKYLKKLLINANPNFIYKMLRNKDIKINGKKVNNNYILQENDILEMFLYEDKFQELSKKQTIIDLPITFEVLYEDKNILIVNKPVGLLVHEDKNEQVNTLANQVLTYLYQKGEYKTDQDNTFVPGPIHRLDRNTSGIVIFGKNLQATQELNEMIKNHHAIEKEYLTITKGKITKVEHLVGYVKKINDEARMMFVKKDDPTGLKIETIISPVQTNEYYSLVKVKLITGRMHQIRIHLASINHPIIGDRKYGDFKLNKVLQRKYMLSNQLLHAYKIKFLHQQGQLSYLNGLEVICPLTKKFKDIKNNIFL